LPHSRHRALYAPVLALLVQALLEAARRFCQS
jgi:hypothetical protein